LQILAAIVRRCGCRTILAHCTVIAQRTIGHAARSIVLSDGKSGFAHAIISWIVVC
jgi:hypothetical protein